MGVCESVSRSNNNNNKNIIIEKGKNEKNKCKNSNNSFESTKNSSIVSKKTEENFKNYILPSNLVIHDDINKYYSINNNEIVGEGGSATIFLGENNKGKFAIKRILKKNCKYKEDLIREVSFSKILNHKNILKYYSVFEDKDYISIVMELGENGDLFEFIVNSPILHIPLKLCIELSEQILSALNYLHNEVKIIHRDLKPENFIIKMDKNDNIICKLIDFGLSCEIEKEKKYFDFLGTLNYCAPEIILRKGYNEKIDIWALGIIIFNLITGCEVFKFENDEDLMDDIKYKKINFDKIENKEIKNLLIQMLNRNDNERINSKDALEIIKNIKKNIKYSEKDDEEYKTFIDFFKKRNGIF